jgi:hypothetical protein
VAAVKGDRPAEEAGGGDGFLVLEDFGVREARVVVDGDVDVFPAGDAAAAALDACLGLGGAAAADPVADTSDAAELF